MKEKIIITKILQTTAGKFHSWCETNIGLVVRKPNNKLDIQEKVYEKENEPKLNWFQKIIRR